MCGISVVINKNGGSVASPVIEAMNDKVIHRGPDDEGYYFGPCFAFGHRRLSILDLSEAGHQPMHRNGYCITYNGEVYNYLELRNELEELGYSFSTETDTEVVLAAYECWKEGAFPKFNGMWAFAIYDHSEQSVIFCRDHFGIKPLYYFQTSDIFIAGSEIKQFTDVPGFSARLNSNAAANFLISGSLNYSDETLFSGVFQILPGHYLKFSLRDSKATIKKWYNLRENINGNFLDFESTKSEFRKLLVDSLRIRMRSDVEIGSCLSGGLDSSAIAVLIKSNGFANDEFKTITSCFNEREYDEQYYSDAVAAATGFVSLKVYPDRKKLLDAAQLDKIIYHQDQPIPSCSHYSEFAVFEAAKKHRLAVMLDGQGADEYLCGYGSFLDHRLKECLFSGNFITAGRILQEKVNQNNSSVFSEVKKLINSNIVYPLADSVKAALKRRRYRYLSKQWEEIALQASGARFSKGVTEHSFELLTTTSVPYQLHSEDRNSMMFSIESRLPYLDPRLVEFSLSLPSRYKLIPGVSKRILREAITELPDVVRTRKTKMAFAFPEEKWMFENGSSILAGITQAVETTGVFAKEFANEFASFLQGNRTYDPIFFRAFSFFRFCEIFKVEISPNRDISPTDIVQDNVDMQINRKCRQVPVA